MFVNKTCNRCNATKPIDQFNRNHLMPDGRLKQCKECTRKYSREFRLNNLEKVRAEDMARSNSEQRKQWKKEWFKKYDARHPGKHKARTAVSKALRDGKMEKQPCFICGDNAEAHHVDYSRPLDVIWLCFKHHRETHEMVME